MQLKQYLLRNITYILHTLTAVSIKYAIRYLRIVIALFTLVH